MVDNRYNGISVEAGKLICFSSGEYSDFGYNGHFLTLEPLTRPMVEEIKAECIREAESRYDQQDNFIPKLIKRGLIMAVDCQVIYLGPYGELIV